MRVGTTLTKPGRPAMGSIKSSLSAEATKGQRAQDRDKLFVLAGDVCRPRDEENLEADGDPHDSLASSSIEVF